MSYKKLLIHRCDIYRYEGQNVESNYGVPINQKNIYSKEPVASEVRCYFTKHIKNAFLSQGDPNNVVTDIMNVHFLKGTDIKMNDKIVHEGIPYRVKPPKLIRNHHIEVEAERIENL